MHRSFAGIYDPSGRDADGDRALVSRSLDAADGVARFGSMTIAWHGDERPTDHGRTVFVDGRLHDPVDTRTLAARHRCEGDELFASLRGDFVIVVHDPALDVVTIARDHMGGRGLFWHESHGRVTFASEVRHLLRLLDATPEPDLVALAHLLAPSGQPVGRSLYDGVLRLAAGHLLELSHGHRAVRRYWMPRYREPAALDRREHVEGLRHVLTRAVDRRSDGRSTAIMLSGGLDSSSVAGVSSLLDEAHRPVRSYSATFPGHPSADEADLIASLNGELHLDGTSVEVRRGSVAAGALTYIEHWRLPPPSPNLFFWLPLLDRAARDGVDAMLDGEGGDELFGLSPYLIADRVRRGRVVDAAALVRAFPGGGPHIGWKAIKPFMLRYGVKGAVPPAIEGVVRRTRGGGRYTPAWLRPSVVDAFMDSDSSGRWKAHDGPRWWAHLVDRVTQGSAAAMTYDHVRRRAALSGIEPRHPLVDVDVIDHVLALPPELAYDTRYSRPLLREAMVGLVPDAVRVRPSKSNFDAIFHEALAGPDLGVARALLRPGRSLLEPYVDLGVVATELLEEPPPADHRSQWAQWVWRLVTAELWLRVRSGEPIDVAFASPDLSFGGGTAAPRAASLT